MKKSITVQSKGLTIGVDLGDTHSVVCVLGEDGEVRKRMKVATSKTAFQKLFGSLPTSRVVLEAGTHSPWVSRQLKSQGHEVLVANARRVRLIYENPNKSDHIDAESLGRVGRIDPKLLAPVQHRELEQQSHLAILRSRDAAVKARTLLVNHVRGAVKAVGARLPRCSSSAFAGKARSHVPAELATAVGGLMDLITVVTGEIQQLDRTIDQVAREHYPVADKLMQIPGVGLLSAMRFVLTLQDPRRFRRNRSVGAFIGLTPRRGQSGRCDPQKRISKAGDSALRWTLLQCSHYILGPFGPDSDMKRHGQKLSQRGGKNSKKRALVAVARRLAVLMLSLWKTGEKYEPLRHANTAALSA